MPNHALFVLACDLPNFDKEAAAYLNARRKPQKKATAFVVRDEVEPLCAIYEPEIFSDLAVFWSKGVHCPKKILSSLDIERVHGADERWLVNINHHHEFDSFNAKRTTKTVKIYYFASLREQASCAEEFVTTEAASLHELFSQVQKKYSFTIDSDLLRFAKNHQLVQGNEPVLDNDEIVFIPPVSGG